MPGQMQFWRSLTFSRVLANPWTLVFIPCISYSNCSVYPFAFNYIMFTVICISNGRDVSSDLSPNILTGAGNQYHFFFQFYVRKIISLSLFIFYILVPNIYIHIMDISAWQRRLNLQASFARLQSPSLSVVFFCSCDKVYHKQEVRFLLY